VDHLLFEQWLDSPEGQKLLKERERQFASGETLTLEELRNKLRVHGKNPSLKSLTGWLLKIS
jgi:hypothetical protein